MKVANTGSQNVAETKQKKTDKVDKSNSKSENSKVSKAELGTSAEVALSDRAKNIQKAREIAKNSAPDVDEAKVAKFQKLIDNGQYKVDAKKVADKLVDENLMNALTEESE